MNAHNSNRACRCLTFLFSSGPRRFARLPWSEGAVPITAVRPMACCGPEPVKFPGATLGAANFTHRRNAVPRHPTAVDGMVSGELLDQSNYDRLVRPGAETSLGRPFNGPLRRLVVRLHGPKRLQGFLFRHPHHDCEHLRQFGALGFARHPCLEQAAFPSSGWRENMNISQKCE
jgi:hypothetical protein